MIVKAVLSAAALVLAAPAWADLKIGDKAPAFTAPAAVGGKTFTFSLAEALQKGPVVVYFYPEAFTPGCTAEAHAFAEAIDQFSALGATVIGVSHDDVEKLKRFSVSECRGKFAVAADPSLAIAKSYDAVMAVAHQYASRTSYVISTKGDILYVYSAMSPEHHVQNTLAAVRKWAGVSPH